MPVTAELYRRLRQSGHSTDAHLNLSISRKKAPGTRPGENSGLELLEDLSMENSVFGDDRTAKSVVEADARSIEFVIVAIGDQFGW